MNETINKLIETFGIAVVVALGAIVSVLVLILIAICMSVPTGAALLVLHWIGYIDWLLEIPR